MLLRGRACLLLWGRACLLLWGRTSLLLRGRACLLLWGRTSLLLRGRACLLLRGRASLLLWGRASLLLRGRACLLLWGRARLMLRGRACLLLRSRARLLLRGIVLRGRGVLCSRSSMLGRRIVLLRRSIVELRGCIVLLRGSGPLRAQRLGGYHILRVASIGLGKRGFVGPGRSRVLCLEAGRRGVLVACGYLLLGVGGMLNAAGTAAIGDAVVVGDGVSLHNRPVTVGGVDSVLIDARDRGVVAEVVPLPLAAGVADAPVAVAIVHAAVVAHVAAPVTAMEPVVAAEPSPVGGRPQRAVIGRRNPGAGHPVVVALVLIVGPIAGHPHHVGLGAVRLLVAGHFRRSESDREDDLCVD